MTNRVCPRFTALPSLVQIRVMLPVTCGRTSTIWRPVSRALYCWLSVTSFLPTTKVLYCAASCGFFFSPLHAAKLHAKTAPRQYTKVFFVIIMSEKWSRLVRFACKISELFPIIRHIFPKVLKMFFARTVYFVFSYRRTQAVHVSWT